MRAARIRIACLVLACTCLPAGAPAQAPRPMSLVELLSVPRAEDPQLSPHGRQVLYVRQDADWKANRRIGHIWRINVDGTGATQLTFGPDEEREPRWSPDGRWIAFLTKRAPDEARQIYLLPAGGGEGRPLTRHPTAVSDIAWAPDGSAIYFLADDPKSDEQKRRENQKDDVYAFDENYQQQHLWRASVPDGATRRITEGNYSVLSFSLARDGRRIAFHRGASPLIGERDQSEVWVMDAAGGNASRLTTNTVGESGAELSPDLSQLLFRAGASARFEPYYNGKVFLIPASGGAARPLAPDFPHDVTAASWSKDGRSVLVVANMGVHSQLFAIDAAAGAATQLTEGDHAIRSWTFVPAGDRHVFQIDEPTRAGDVWVMAATGGAALTRVTDIFGYLTRDFRLPRQEKVQWKGADGAIVEGLLFYPLDYQPGTRYPLCVQTHGGPAASDKFGFQGWRDYVPVLTARGYFVLKPNYRGSTGYGDPFLRDMVGHYFRNAHLDVMAGVDHLIRLGLVDETRMVKMGWSGGGHMTNRIITFTDRFKAASSGAGAANWISMYAQSDTRIYRTPWFGGTPWQKNAPIDVYWEHSPLTYVANVRTPTIFLVGAEDLRVPMAQSVEMYRALKANGVPTRLYIAPREPHGWNELRHQLFKLNVEIEWFERWATGRPYTWEKAPEEKPGTTSDSQLES